jgi:hypothetical protein
MMVTDSWTALTTGNTYSIENDYDHPARVFFSQGCEPTQRPAEEEEAAT